MGIKHEQSTSQNIMAVRVLSVFKDELNTLGTDFTKEMVFENKCSSMDNQDFII